MRVLICCILNHWYWTISFVFYGKIYKRKKKDSFVCKVWNSMKFELWFSACAFDTVNFLIFFFVLIARKALTLCAAIPGMRFDIVIPNVKFISIYRNVWTYNKLNGVKLKQNKTRTGEKSLHFWITNEIVIINTLNPQMFSRQV